MTPQELLLLFVAKSDWLAEHVECYATTVGYEFSNEEIKLFQVIAKYLIKIRNSDNYEENLNCLFTLFEQLNK